MRGGVLPRAMESLTETTTISYSYDPLSRVTGATYAGGWTNSYGYAYDAVGNRTVQTQTITSTLVITYGYDIANRLTNVNGQPYTWDDNGNLLNDGAQTYGYDQANRLKQVVQGAITTTFAYNGLGDRLQQTVNSSPTRYVLDPAAGLTQVLADGTNTYLYGNARLGQYQVSMQYFGADGLGSVRQIYDASAVVVGSSRYDPYGNVISQSGVGTSPYGYAGEWTDATGLEYLRTRYYASYLNQWIQPDPIISDYANPQSLNRYTYVLNNPVRYTDPSGRTREDNYVFVQGCSQIPLQPVVCQNQPQEDLQNYLRFFQAKFGFPAAAPNDRFGKFGLSNEFIGWTESHVKFVHSATSDPGGINTAIQGINRGSGSIFLIGHSVGGTAIIRYLTELKERDAQNPGIAGAVAVDAPLQGDLGVRSNLASDYAAMNLGFGRYQIGIRWDKLFGDCPPIPVPYLQDKLAGLGKWAEDQGIRLLQVSYADDVFNPTRQVADIPQVVVATDPNYAGRQELEKKHGYLLSGPGAWPMLEGLFVRGVLR